MQLAMTILFIAWGALLESWWVTAAAVISAAYSAGIAAWDERGDLTLRFGPAWAAYRREVCAWFPRWRPYVAPGSRAKLYLAEGCVPCSEVWRWLAARQPRGLELLAAEDYPVGGLTRITYVRSEGDVEHGVAALAHGLEHLHLGWAFLGWLLRLPVVCQVVQLLVDALGGAPRVVAARGNRGAGTVVIQVDRVDRVS
jgi:hypothetical protein